MDYEHWKAVWEQEERAAHIHGWDFSHIQGKYSVETDLPWDYRALVNRRLTSGLNLLDYDTGGGEFLLSLRHSNRRTSATEGYPDLPEDYVDCNRYFAKDRVARGQLVDFTGGELAAAPAPEA